MIFRIGKKPWGLADKVSVLIPAIFGLWTAIPSSIFLQPVSLTITPTVTSKGKPTLKVSFGRDTPFGGQTADWITEVRGPRRSCSIPPGRTTYGKLSEFEGGDNFTTYNMDRKLFDCVVADEPFIYHTTHSVRLLGVLPLRAVRTTWTCPGSGGVCSK